KKKSLNIIEAMITTVTGKNQITIPAKLATQLDIQPGTQLDWSIGEGGVLIARLLPPRAKLARKVAGMGRQWLTQGVDPVADLIQERAQADVDEMLT
ncbi:MAG: AbrB/MazE/SpoVT family DNA-binding domain-containing protein, partial [Chloroflexi bacterium]|nr:AbrB/MazE/SpoVT family DNA-binding domain-containing protein [Chloroflexota bacterium]